MEWVLPTLSIFLVANIVGFTSSYLILYTSLFEKFRIQKRPYPKGALWERLPLVAMNAGIIVVSVTVGLSLFGWVFTKAEVSYWILIGQFLFILLVDDFYFYWWHRIMHENKTLYKKVHKIHHRAYTPFPLDYLYVHPIELIVGYGSIGLAVLLLYLMQGYACIHSFWAYAIFRTVHELDAHSGIKSAVFTRVPLIAEAEHHDLHHAKPTLGNYATALKLWDKILKTEIVLGEKTSKKAKAELSQQELQTETNA